MVFIAFLVGLVAIVAVGTDVDDYPEIFDIPNKF